MNELRANYPTTVDIYARLRDRSTGDVWNGSEFVSWEDDDVANYAVSLTNLGGDLFAASMPDGIGDRQLLVGYYIRTGEDASIGDDRIRGEEISWNGSFEVDGGDPGPSPVTRDEMIAHMRLDGVEVQTDLLDLLIISATQYYQNESRRQLMWDTKTIVRDSFPSARTIALPFPPLQSVTSITYLDENGESQTLSADFYTVDSVTLPGRIALKENHSWPLTQRTANAVTITFVAGYGGAPNVPAIDKTAIRLLVAHWYENREGSSQVKLNDIPFGVRAIIDQNMFAEAV